MKLFKPLVPVDAAGLDFSRPIDQRVWSKLTNVYFDDGFLLTRPAMRPVGPLVQDTATRRAGIITAIREGRRWATEASSVGTKQRVVPTSTATNSGWTIVGAATVHAAIDDTDPPDNDTTYVEATADGSSFSVAFGALAGTPDFIDDLVLHIRAKATHPLLQSLLVSWPGGGDPVEIRLTNTDYDGSDGTDNQGYQDYFIPVPLASGYAWDASTIDAFFVPVVEFAEEPASGSIYYFPDTSGSDDDFTPAGDDWMVGGSGQGIDVFTVDRATVVRGDIGDRKSVIFLPTGTPLTTVTDVTVRFTLAKETINGAAVTIYFKSGGTRYPLATAQQITRRYDASIWDDSWGWTDVEVTVATNPATLAAWTPAELESGLEFGIEVEDFGDGDVVMTYADLKATGVLGTGGARITQMNLIAGERTSNGELPQNFYGRLMSTTTSFQRLDNEVPEGNSFDDILAAATAPTANWWNWDTAEFFGSIYFENSVDTTYVFGGGDDTSITQLTAPLPIGHTMWSFAQRLFKGDVTDTGTRHPKRIAWSALADPNDWTGASAGDLDLTHGGDGRVRKGLPLSAMTAAIYLDKGIYTLRWTGDDSAPFVPRLMDSDTGIVAPNTCRPVLDQGGEAVHMFLGRGPQGLGVYAFDGSSAQSVSHEIDGELRRLHNIGTVEFSMAWVCPETNLYILFVPEGTQSMPEQAWVYHIDNGHWTRWEFPFGVSAVGEWTLVDDNSGLTEFNAPRDAHKKLIMGTSFGIPYKLDYEAGSDYVSVPGIDAPPYFTSASGLDKPTAPREVPIDIEIRTGAFVLAEEMQKQSTPMRLWITFEDRGQMPLLLDACVDGGTDDGFGDETEFQLGNEDFTIAIDDEPARLTDFIADFTNPTAGRRHILRLRNNQTEDNPRGRLKVSKFIVEYEEGGDLP